MLPMMAATRQQMITQRCRHAMVRTPVDARWASPCGDETTIFSDRGVAKAKLLLNRCFSSISIPCQTETSPHGEFSNAARRAVVSRSLADPFESAPRLADNGSQLVRLTKLKINPVDMKYSLCSFRRSRPLMSAQAN